MTAVRDWPGLWHEWLLAYDPALTHLRRTVRATAAVAIALAAGTQVAAAAGKPPTVALLGSVVALLASMLPRDATPKAQRTTIALMAVSAAVTSIIGTLLAPSRLIGDSVFVLIAFSAVYVRRWGPRGFALGMAGFIPYFLNVILHLKLALLPWSMLAIAIGAASAALMRFIVLPDRPVRELQHTLRAVRANVSQLLDTTGKAIDAGRWTHWRRYQLQHRLLRLNATVLSAEELLDGAAKVKIRADLSAEAFHERLFGLELSAERVIAVARRGRPVEVAAQRGDLARLRRAGGRAVFDDRQKTTRLSRPLQALRAALNALPASTSVRIEPRPPQPPPPPSPEARGESTSSGMPPTTRQAIQVSIASALAVGAGELLSPNRWYWAVIAAFVVFNGTSSRGETFVKGWQRMLGTIGGVLAGVLIATAVGGAKDLAIGLIFVCIFFAFYSIRGAYAAFIFWLTILLALMYGLLGHFTPELLLLRLEETALGAVIGVLVATFVLPVSSRAAYQQARGQCLTALADALAACSKHIVNANAGGDLIAAARALDRQLHDVEAKAQPLMSSLAAKDWRSGVRHTVRNLTGAAYYSRNLARLSDQVKPSSPLAQAMCMAAQAIAHNARALGDGNASIQSAAQALERVNKLLSAAGTSEEQCEVRVFRLLGWIDRLLVRLTDIMK